MMKVHLQNAVQNFYANPSYEQLYFEAVANALDAGATTINISIDIESFTQVSSLTLKIVDNGRGFVDDSFERFCTLLNPADQKHKGIGRLIYLYHFGEVEVISNYEDDKQRRFLYTLDFDAKSDVVESCQEKETTICFRKFKGDRIKSYRYLKPSDVRDSLIAHFFPRFFEMKQSGKNLKFSITLDTRTPNSVEDFASGSVSFSLEELPELDLIEEILPNFDLVAPVSIYYKIDNNDERPSEITTAICVDERTHDITLIDNRHIPNGFQVVFFFSCALFDGITDASRQEFNPVKLDKPKKDALRAKVGQILTKEIPMIHDRNEIIKTELSGRYPHLEGYFPNQEIGLVIRDDALEEAQRRFFQDEKQVLECNELDEKRYEQALKLSARTLLEYVLYRNRIIQKLKEKISASEGDIHDVIVPRQNIYHHQTALDDVYNNNIWLLDDKYMSYATVLSEQSMDALIKEIDDSETGDEGRPDIAIVFSKVPEDSQSVDVVIVELKKQEIKLAKKEEVISQLRQRARRLLKFYNGKLNRIWFYGVTEIDAEFRLSLKEDGYQELYSNGQLFHKAQPIYLDEGVAGVNVDVFIMNYDALISDAENRNMAFLEMLKKSIRNFTEVARIHHELNE